MLHAVRNLKRQASALLADRSGNFALMFALTSVPILIALGCSFDYVQALNTHRRMQTALDAALVAAVKDVGTSDDTALKSRIADWINADSTTPGAFLLDTSGIQIDHTKSTITASVSTVVPTSFLKIAGIKQIPVAVSSGVVGGTTVTKSAFSMYLVLDRSGSMDEDTTTTYTTKCGSTTCTKVYTKMEALKLAVASLTTQLSQADPSTKYVRMAAVSYNNSMQTPTPLAWGETAALNYVNALSSSGKTDSSKAIATAYAALTDTTNGKDENKIHQAKNGVTNPKKYIVFMTDGANNIANADTSTKATCDLARKNDVTIYTIAFMAPKQGQDLLKYCATTLDDYFPAESTADIVNAFSSIGESSSNNLIRLTQ
jgi:Flp pilus assembly protein TadG